MDAIRARLGTAVEWLVAAAFLVGAAFLGSLLEHQVRSVSGPPARQAPASTFMPAVLAGRAVAVPVLVLLDGKEVRLGDAEPRVAALLGRSAETDEPHVDRRGKVERVTRFYDHQGTRFALVFERRLDRRETKVAGIYVR